MGILALGNMVLAVFAAVVMYQVAVAAWRMPIILNLPGTFFTFSAVISLSQWLQHDLFDGYMHMPAPKVPWYYSLMYIGVVVLWYTAMALLLALWRELTNQSPKVPMTPTVPIEACPHCGGKSGFTTKKSGCNW